MKNQKSKLIILFFIGHSLIVVKAQQAVPAAGGDATGSGGTVNYSVGQVVYTSSKGTNGTVSQGVQQPYEFFTVGIDSIKDISLSITVYPNPTASSLSLNVNNHNLENLSFQLYDITGKLLINQKIYGTVTDIPMLSLANAVYFLKVSNKKREIKTFKIIKN